MADKHEEAAYHTKKKTTAGHLQYRAPNVVFLALYQSKEGSSMAFRDVRAGIGIKPD